MCEPPLGGPRCTLPSALVARAKLVLWSAEGRSNTEIAKRLRCTKATVGKWRKRFVEHRVAGLYDEIRPGRPRSIEHEQIAALLKRTVSSKPSGATHWTVRDAARASGLSKSTVHRLFQTFALQPHRTRTFKLSTDPSFVEKVRDVVGLYLNPPDHAMVLCVDEKSQIQAGAACALSRPLYSDLLFLAQPSGTMVRVVDATRDPSRLVSQRSRSGEKD